MSGALASLSDQVRAVSDIYAASFGIDRDGDWALLKLQEELGELVQAHLKLTGRADAAARAPEARADEAADVLVHAAALLPTTRRRPRGRGRAQVAGLSEGARVKGPILTVGPVAACPGTG